jgi:isoquinoline 1-oxidoreductase beta subunit
MKSTKAAGTWSRRELLTASALAGGGFLLSLHLPLATAAGPRVAAGPGPRPPPPLTPNAFIAIDDTGIVTITVPVVEMGQGTYTSVPILIAEELSVDLANMRAIHAPVSPLYGNPGLGGQQATGASTSMRGLYVPMRRAGAAARMMLVSAAAKSWKVPATECAAADGAVTHGPTGRKLTYGALAAVAAREPVPTEVVLKDPKQFKLIGKSAQRLDIVSKVDGSAVFGIDAIVPGMKLAGVISCPVFGGRVAHVDDRKAMAVNGVRQVIVLPDAVAVVADHTGAVRKALAALEITWDEGPNANFSTDKWTEQLHKAAQDKGAVAVDKGNAREVIAGAPLRFSADYYAPPLAHAPMEPLNSTVRLTATECEVWTGTQSPAKVLAQVARLTGLPPDKVQIHNAMLGGGFGRRLETDQVEQAILIAQQAQVPVKVIWSREEDIRHDFYRPYYYDQLSAGFDANGNALAISHRVVGSSIIARLAGGHFKGVDSDAVECAETPYDFAAKYVEYVPSEGPVPTGFFRGVGPNHNTCVVEGFMDELAGFLGKDPYEFRRSLLAKNPRARAVLELVAQKIGWGRALPDRHGHGIAVVDAWGSYAALAVEVAVDKDGQVTLRHLVAAVDCGQQINPDGIEAQLQSGVIFGMTAALHGRITVASGRVVQSNFHDYPLLRMFEVPPFEVHLIASHESPGGIGEIGTTLPSPALLNAIHAATGKRLRQLPVNMALLARA